MSELKLCPFLLNGLIVMRAREAEADSPFCCLREKCAMWRAFDIEGMTPELAHVVMNEKRALLGLGPLEKAPDAGGYCGLAGKP